MSSFICDKCGKEIIDALKGHISECEHYPMNKPKTARDILKELVEWCIENHGYGLTNAIEGALKDLDALVPKKKDSEDYYGTTEHGKGRCDGFNNAVEAMHRIYKGE